METGLSRVHYTQVPKDSGRRLYRTIYRRSSDVVIANAYFITYALFSVYRSEKNENVSNKFVGRKK